jgi:hypothetical protein
MSIKIPRLYTDEDLHELLLRVHTTAREKGWWTLSAAGHDSAELAKNAKCVLEDGDLEDKLFLVVCETAEAFEEYRKPNIDIKAIYVRWHSTHDCEDFEEAFDTENPEHKTMKPEGFPIEMGDAYIRVLDLMGALDLVPEPVVIVDVGREAWTKPGKHLFKIMGEVARGDVNPRRALSQVLAGIEACCHELGVDLATAIEIKAAYNKTRPARHGGKRA